MSIWQRLRALGKTDRIHQEMEDEFAFHVETRIRELVDRGTPEAEARHIAQAAFGHQSKLREDSFAIRGAGTLEDCWNDLRLSLRLLCKNPVRTGVLIATLALGLGMSSAIFSIVRTVLLRPLPFSNPAQLVVLHQARAVESGGVSYPHFRDWRAAAKAFSGMAVFGSGESTVVVGDRSERLLGASVSANLFSLLQVNPLRGRLFRTEEDKLGGGDNGERPLLVHEGFWRSRMGSREDIVGQHLTIDGFEFRIIGVIPAAAGFPLAVKPVQFWTTVAADAEPSVFGGSVPEARGYPAYDGALARLQTGVTISSAQAEMNRLAILIERAHPKATSMNQVVIRSALDEFVGRTRPLLMILYAAVFCVLLVACANVATLLLVSALARRREFGIRSALGASSVRLMRQVLIENAFLGLCGGALGLPVAVALVRICVAVAPAETPRLSAATVDVHAFFYSLALSLLVGVLVGLVPAIAAVRRDVQDDLRDNARTANRHPRTARGGSLLIASQIAVCMILTCAASLLVNSFIRILNVPRGFDPHSIVTATISLPHAQYSQGSDRIRNYYRTFIAELQKSPLVVNATVAERLPLSGNKNSTTVQVVGSEENGLPSTDLRFVDQDYCATLRIPVTTGRFFTAADDQNRPPVAVVNAAFVRRYLQGRNAEGRLLKLGWGGDKPRRVVGVIADLKNQALDIGPIPEVYVPAAQFPNRGMSILVRTRTAELDIASLFREIAKKIDNTVPVDRIRTLDDYLLLSVATQKFLMSLLIVFAASTIVIAAVGIYGLLSFTTTRRNQEFGIRMALGSRPAQLLRLVLRQGISLAFLGVCFGSLLSHYAASLLSRWLYQPETIHWSSLGVAATLMLLIAFLASYLPARRASRVDPLVAIRAE